MTRKSSEYTEDMSLSKQNYEAVAAILDFRQSNLIGDERAVVEDIANDLANYFIGENERFDEHKFLTACGFGE